jgi:hypothetical protein
MVELAPRLIPSRCEASVAQIAVPQLRAATRAASGMALWHACGTRPRSCVRTPLAKLP